MAIDYTDEYEEQTPLPEYTDPTYKRFVEDMRDAGFEVEHYFGRFFYEGPAVRTDEDGVNDLQTVIRATRVKVQYDNMGLDHIVYVAR